MDIIYDHITSIDDIEESFLYDLFNLPKLNKEEKKENIFNKTYNLEMNDLILVLNSIKNTKLNITIIIDN